MDDIQSQIDEINGRLDDSDSANQDFSDSVDSSINDMQSSIDDQSSNISDLQDTAGQLQFPLTQDTKDLIDEQIDTGITDAIDYFNVVPLPLTLPQLTRDLVTMMKMAASGVVSDFASVTLVNGIGTVTGDTAVTTNSIIVYNRGDINGSSAIGLLYIANQASGTFSIASLKYDSSGIETNDNSIINYVIFNL
jgi:hypothetical protein